MTTLVLMGLILAQTEPGAPVVTRQAEEKVPAESLDPTQIRAQPEVIVRGRSTTITLTSRDLESLKTVEITPPAGVKAGAIKEVAAPRAGEKAVTMTVSVDPDAAPGDRSLTVVSKVNFQMTGRSDDPKMQEAERLFREMAQKQAGRAEVGMIHINSHEVTIADVSVTPDAGGAELLVTVVDSAGDISAELKPPQAAGAKDDDATIEAFSPPVVADVRCGDEMAETFVDIPKEVEKKDAGKMIVKTRLEGEGLKGKCEVRTRVEDKAGNLSDWFSKTVQFP